jgi:hypothetical protein
MAGHQANKASICRAARAWTRRRAASARPGSTAAHTAKRRATPATRWPAKSARSRVTPGPATGCPLTGARSFRASTRSRWNRAGTQPDHRSPGRRTADPHRSIQRNLAAGLPHTMRCRGMAGRLATSAEATRTSRSVRRDGPVMPVLPDDGKIRHREPPLAGLWLAASSARSATTFGGTRI